MRKARSNPKPGLIDLWVLVPVMVLLVIGLWCVLDASYAKAVDYDWTNKDSWYFAKRQILSAGIGLILMYCVSRARLRAIAWFTKPLLVVSIVLLVLVLVIGYEANGAKRWFNFYGFRLQPSEIAKLALVLYLAQFLAQGKAVVRRINLRWAPVLLSAGMISGLILIEPDMGTTMAVVAICLAMAFAAGAKKWHLGAAVGACGFLAWLAVQIEPYRLSRVAVWLDPWKYRYGAGYQIVHSLIALGTGGLLGLGPCEGREKLYIPAASTDFVFSTVAEEFGLIGSLVLLGLFLLLVYKGFQVARDAKCTYAALLAVGISSMIGLQALINVAVVSSSIPATGVPLLFISYGGSSLILTLAGIGIRRAVSRQRAQPSD
jgi:cell division protein FtsW